MNPPNRLPSRLPSHLPRPPGELEALEAAWQPPRGWRGIFSVNNTFIGKLYIGTALLFLLLAGVLALMIRAQLAAPGLTLVDAPLYQQLFTMHGTMMMFLFAIPIVEALAVFMLPNMLGARDLPLPRLSAYAYWAYAFGGLAFFCTLFVGLAPDSGWFMYPPLSGRTYSPGLNADFWLLGIGFIEISAIAGAIELILGILMTRAPGMTLARMPVYAWSMLVVGLMIVLAFPPVIAGTALLEIERAFDWPIFDATRGGDPLLWQHLFWFFGHPEVYIIFLPAAGLVSTLLPALARRRLMGRRPVVASLCTVGGLSFLLWAHHMFTAGLGGLGLSLVSLFSVAIAVPGCVQIFAWLGTLWRQPLQWTTATWFVAGFLAAFTLGGLTGVMLALLPFDWQAHDTQFVVGHLHYVLIGGMLFPVMAGLYHWMPLWKGRPLSERCGRWVFGLMFGGFNVAFFPMHLAGLRGMPRRVHTYEAGLGWEVPNLLSSVGALVLALGVALFIIDLVRSQWGRERPTGNPWRAGTLEWLPSGNYGTRSIPQVDDGEPLWRHPGLPEEVTHGGHWLPGTATGGRETLLTSPVQARPLRLMLLGRDSAWPLLAALGTAVFFLAMTVKAWVLTVLGGLLALVGLCAWLWNTDRAPPLERAEVARDVWLPVGGAGRHSATWWATWIVLVVGAVVWASMAFAHLHVAMRLEVCPPAGTTLPPLRWPALATAGYALSAALLWWAGQGAQHRVAPAWRAGLLLPALLLAGLAFEIGRAALFAGGTAPQASAWMGTLAALLGYQGLHLVLLAVLAGFLGLRIALGMVQPRQLATRDNTRLLWLGTCLQGALTVWWPHAVA